MRLFPSRDYDVLTDIIRRELSPVRSDLEGLRATVASIAAKQERMYSEREIDRMFTEVRGDLQEQKATLAALTERIGGAWRQLFTTAAIVLSPVSTLLFIFYAVTHYFH